MTEAAFYTVTGRDFFPGAVALLNSLRLTGHSEPLIVLDAGMNPDQRRLLEPHATIIPGSSEEPPSLQKLLAPIRHPARSMALLDADVIVTRPLTEPIGAAASGRLVAFENDRQRFFAEWADLLGLERLPRRPYVSTSAVFLGDELARDLLQLAQRLQMKADRTRTWLGGGRESDPLYYLDQDVLNAVVAARVGRDRLDALDPRLAPNPPFRGLHLVDRATLRCAYRDSSQPYLLHHWARKPWLVRVRSNVYSRLLSRLLFGPDVPLRLRQRDLPLRLRSGLAGDAARLGLDLVLTLPGAYRRLARRTPRVRAWPNPGSAAEGGSD